MISPAWHWRCRCPSDAVNRMGIDVGIVWECGKRTGIPAGWKEGRRDGGCDQAVNVCQRVGQRVGCPSCCGLEQPYAGRLKFVTPERHGLLFSARSRVNRRPRHEPGSPTLVSAGRAPGFVSYGAAKWDARRAASV